MNNSFIQPLLKPSSPTVAVVIPAFRVRGQILNVIKEIPAFISTIIVIDDCCPERSGAYVERESKDERVVVLFNPTNLGVGGAVKRGFEEAVRRGVKIVVKMDGDGQMKGEDLIRLVAPIMSGHFDYMKGNRFWKPSFLADMPKIRLFGNAVLSFAAKLSTGYWSIMDPNNGFIAVHSVVAKQIEWEKVANRFFFETDLLFRLNLMGAKIGEMPQLSHYRGEKSNLSPLKVAPYFLFNHIKIFLKRITYQYFLRDINIGSLGLVLGFPLFIFGLVFGSVKWWQYAHVGLSAPLGTIMIAALSVVVGLQFLFLFLSYDMSKRNYESLIQMMN